jgi:hypothetical protein
VHRGEGKRSELVAHTRAFSTAQDSKLLATAHEHEGRVRAVAHPEKARHAGALPAHGSQHGLAACTVEAVVDVDLADAVALSVEVLRGHGHARHARHAEHGAQIHLQRLKGCGGAAILGVHDGHLRGDLQQESAVVHRPQLGIEPTRAHESCSSSSSLCVAINAPVVIIKRNLAVGDRLDQSEQRLHDVSTAARRTEQVHVPFREADGGEVRREELIERTLHTHCGSLKAGAKVLRGRDRALGSGVHDELGAWMLIGDTATDECPERCSFPPPAQPLDSSARATGSTRLFLGHSQRVAVIGELSKESLKLWALYSIPLKKRDKDSSRKRKEIMDDINQCSTTNIKRGRNTHREGSKRADPGSSLLLSPRVGGRERVKRKRRASNAQDNVDKGRINISKGSVDHTRFCDSAGRISISSSTARHSTTERSITRHRATGRGAAGHRRTSRVRSRMRQHRGEVTFVQGKEKPQAGRVQRVSWGGGSE